VNLLPLLEQKQPHLAARPFFWRYGVQFAVRSGNWKLVKANQEMAPMLVDLDRDPGEQHDLTEQNPARAADLLVLWKKWNDALPPQKMSVADSRSDGHERAKRGERARDKDGE
ncbi:MAG: N-acetylgalactosamine 6-sulfatase, partial [Lacunisphaera sp.]|nr:N-acetylgalactosamine 6-sulfatase [Lacunisphaera sp.]